MMRAAKCWWSSRSRLSQPHQPQEQRQCQEPPSPKQRLGLLESRLLSQPPRLPLISWQVRWVLHDRFLLLWYRTGPAQRWLTAITYRHFLVRGFLCTWGVSGGIFLGYVVAPQCDSGTGETNLQFLQVMLIKCFRDIYKASCAIAASKQNTMHMCISLQRLLMLKINSAHQSVANSCQFETNSRL